jgi:TolA-binding protein
MTFSGRNLNDEQIELAKRQETTQAATLKVESENRKVLDLEQQIRGLTGEVERIQNRDLLKEKVQMYDVRLAVQVLEDRAAQVEEKQAAIDRANKDLAEYVL